MAVGKILMWAAALAFAAFAIKMIEHIALWFGRTGLPIGGQSQSVTRKWRACFAALPEIFFLRRLLKANPAIWLGEWIFHASFILVLVRHLKYFLTPAPQFVWQMQDIGGIAGYVMPVSLLYIIIMKAVINRGRYVFAFNYFLITAFLLASLAGVIMRTFFYPDTMQVKEFIMGALRLKAAAAPQSLSFIIHFCLALIILPFLPTHIFAAPFTIYQARKRDKELKTVIHGPNRQ